MNIVELKNEAEIDGYLEELKQKNCNMIALDIEGEFNLHCYGEHLCLVQIYDGEQAIIIDPQQFDNSSGLKKILEKRDLLKIVYDAGSDSVLLEHACGIRLRSILDLRPAVTLLGHEKQSLANVLEAELGLEPINKKKFQQYNWMRRPIDPQALHYAMSDVLHLFKLKERLFARLAADGLMDDYMLQNLMVQNRDRDPRKKHEKAKGYNRLNKTQQELFGKLFLIRDTYARELNRPPHYVFSNSELLGLCKPGADARELLTRGINPRIPERTRNALLHELSSTFSR